MEAVALEAADPQEAAEDNNNNAYAFSKHRIGFFMTIIKAL